MLHKTLVPHLTPCNEYQQQLLYKLDKAGMSELAGKYLPASDFQTVDNLLLELLPEFYFAFRSGKTGENVKTGQAHLTVRRFARIFLIRSLADPFSGSAISVALISEARFEIASSGQPNNIKACVCLPRVFKLRASASRLYWIPIWASGLEAVFSGSTTWSNST